jgi:predicted N-acetyltransferase YhbS
MPSNPPEYINHAGKMLLLRLANEVDVPALRKLVNEAYKELSDKGWNYTATYQDEEVTRRRMQKGRAFVLEDKGKIIATILFYVENQFTGINQLT